MKKKVNTVWRKNIIDQLMHVGATPSVLKGMEEGVQHICQVINTTIDEIYRLRAENKKLKRELKTWKKPF